MNLLEWIEWQDLESDLKDGMYSLGRQFASHTGGDPDHYQRLVCSRSGKPETNVLIASKCNCGFHLNFTKKKWNGKHETIRLSTGKNSACFTHSVECLPNMVIKEGNVLRVDQLTPGMIDHIEKSHQNVATCMIRDSLHTQNHIDYIAMHVVRTVIRRARQHDESVRSANFITTTSNTKQV